MASFSALLYLDGKLYRVVWCQYAFRQPVDHRGRPRRKVLKGPIYVELWTGGVYPELTQWAADSHKTLSGRLVFARPDQPDSAFAHVWFTHATCTTHYERFDSSGQGLDGSLRLLLIISPEDMGRDAGSGEEWVPPLARECAYSGRAAAVPAAPNVPVDLTGKKPPKSTPEGKAWRWARYQREHAGDPNAWDYARWEKQFHVNSRNAEFGLRREKEYCDALGGESKTFKTAYTKRQVDIFIDSQEYCGQLKTGKVSHSDQAKIDLQKDEWLIQRGYQVEYILEKGASKNLLKALDAIGATYKLGPQIP
ncbi:type VI secretion system tube protein TssD [Hymenobacter weizhouensis]|uniref:type VI secretion system tube protein TssD n=1 Tax=Hymenobacter sp. YIM 151500-1 TaxID=2987689 RepID=UPI0022275322|nr:type VI secretion system tube protein TssD [Hymenobacter sp. YIM 151500-1]UYZ63942.1 hypothetical protein OIS53_03645 [Hymenobacter sp. YIM 151500-1]